MLTNKYTRQNFGLIGVNSCFDNWKSSYYEPGWVHNWMNPHRHRHRHNEWKKTGPQKRTKQVKETWICENEPCKLLMGGCGCTLVHATAQSERLFFSSACFSFLILHLVSASQSVFKIRRCVLKVT
jgi:hypothetical protein